MNNKKRQYKRFTTSISIEILKELKISAIQEGVTVSKMLEIVWNFVRNIDPEIVHEIRNESIRTGIPTGKVLSQEWKRMRNETNIKNGRI